MSRQEQDKRVRKNQELDLKAEIERSVGRSEGAITFGVVAGAVGLGIELLQNEKAHASTGDGGEDRVGEQTDGSTDRPAAAEGLQQSQASMPHAHAGVEQAQNDASGQTDGHAHDTASPLGAQTAGANVHAEATQLDQSRQAESTSAEHAAMSATHEGDYPSSDGASRDDASVPDGSSGESGTVDLSFADPSGGVADILSPAPGGGGELLAGGLPPGIGGAVSAILDPAVDLLKGLQEDGLLSDVLSTVGQVIGGTDGSLLGKVSDLADDLDVSAVLDPVTDLLSGVTETLGDTVTGTLGDVLNVTTALTPVTGMLSSTSGVVSNILSTAGDLLGEQDGRLLPDLISKLTDGLGISDDGSGGSGLLSSVTDALGDTVTGTLGDVLNVTTALTPVTGMLSGTTGVVSNVLSVAGDLVTGGEGNGLLPDVIAKLTDGLGVSDGDGGSGIGSDLLAGAMDTLNDTVTGSLGEVLNVTTVLTPVTDALSGTTGVVSNVLSVAGDLATGGEGNGPLPDVIAKLTDGLGVSDGDGGSGIGSDLLTGVTDTLDDTVTGSLGKVLNVTTALTPVADALPGTSGVVWNVLSAAGDPFGEQGGAPLPDVIAKLTDGLGVSDGDGGSGIGSGLLSDVTDTLDDTITGTSEDTSNVSTPAPGVLSAAAGAVSSTSDIVATVTSDNGSSLISNLASRVATAIGGGQSNDTVSDGDVVIADEDMGDHGGPGPISPATETATLTADVHDADDLPALPGVGDVLDLTSNLVGVIVPTLGFLGQTHIEADEHHDLGNSHGSLLHGLI